MGYRLMSWAAVHGMRIWDRVTEQRGQGTVEYIGIAVMVALLGGAVAVVAKGWGADIGDTIKEGLTKAIKGLVKGLVFSDK